MEYMRASLSLSDLYSVPNLDLLWRVLMDVLKFFNFSYEYLICPILPYLILYFVIFPLPVFRPTCITSFGGCNVIKYATNHFLTNSLEQCVVYRSELAKQRQDLGWELPRAVDTHSVITVFWE